MGRERRREIERLKRRSQFWSFLGLGHREISSRERIKKKNSHLDPFKIYTHIILKVCHDPFHSSV